jgi:hypothetical protein
VAAVTYKDQPRAITEAGVLLPGASLRLTLEGTDTDARAYANAELTIEHPNPLVADGAARFPAMFFDQTIDYRARLLHPVTGAVVWDKDPLETFPLSDSGIPLDNNGRAMPGAVLTFWRAGTTALQGVFLNEALSTPADNPLEADVDGEFPEVWFDDELTWRVKLEDGRGRLVFDIDEYTESFPAPQPAFLPPGAVLLSGEMVDVGDWQAELDWTAATAGTYPVDEYDVFRNEDGGAYSLLTTVSAPLHTYDDTTVVVDVLYRYYVVARDNQGNDGAASNIIELVANESVFPVAGWVNPGAELGDMTGWVDAAGNMDVLGPNVRFPPVGAWIFWGGTTATSKRYQRFDVAATGVSLTDVDNGDTQLVIDWWGGTFIQIPADQPAINWRFLDASLSVIGSGTSGYKNPTTQYGTNIRWDPYEETAAIPALTRYVDIELEAKRNNGSNNDAAFDEVVPRVELVP